MNNEDIDPDVPFGITELATPSLFLGIISPRRDDFPEAALLPMGQYVYGHQYNGHSCSQTFLRGIFVPVGAITDQALNGLLREMPQHYGIGSSTTDEAFQDACKALRNAGAPPAMAADPNGGSAEGLFRFAPEPFLGWLRRKGEYVVDCTSVRSVKTMPLDWNSIAEFSDWLSGNGKIPLRSSRWMPKHQAYQEKSDDVVGALVYENGD